MSGNKTATYFQDYSVISGLNSNLRRMQELSELHMMQCLLNPRKKSAICYSGESHG